MTNHASVASGGGAANPSAFDASCGGGDMTNPHAFGANGGGDTTSGDDDTTQLAACLLLSTPISAHVCWGQSCLT
jgi:hypothetical protein